MNLAKKVNIAFKNWAGHEAIEKSLARFNNLNIYLAGGVVRDSILNNQISPKDFDFIITGSQVDDFFVWLKSQGKMGRGQFLAPRWFPSEESDCYCDLMDIRKWDTGLTRCHTVIDVLKQFDFTGNAVAINLRNNDFINPVNGFSDNTNRVLRAIRMDFPDLPIRDDTKLTKMAIHWFRFLLYSLRLDFEIDDATRLWLEKNLKYLEQKDIYCSEFGELQENIQDAIIRQKMV